MIDPIIFPDPPKDASGSHEGAYDAIFVGLPVSQPTTGTNSRDEVELAATAFQEALRRGERPSIEEFARRYPPQATQIREILPLVAAMERWKTNREMQGARAVTKAPPQFERLGNCRILREIGRGGMGVVFEAVQEPLGRRVAVKLLPWRFAESSLWRRRFHREARTTARLRHRHIVPVYEFGEQEGWCYYVMQLIEGLSLDRIIKLLKEPPGAVSAREMERIFAAGPEAAKVIPKPLTPVRPVAETDSRVFRRDAWAQIAKVGLQAADALRYAHGRGTLHRDIKPANLLLDCNGAIWLADFGIASRKDPLSESGEHFGGTLPYLAPEQLDGRADERSDIYALGITLYELCTLTPAFEGATRIELLDKLRHQSPRAPRTINRHLPVTLGRILLKATDKAPEKRFQTAGDLLQALRRFHRQLLGQEPHPPKSSLGNLFGGLFGKPDL